MQQPKINLYYNGIYVKHDELYQNDFIISSVDYTDRRTGAADDIDVELWALNGKWKSDLIPEKGDTLKIEFVSGDTKLITPEMYIDGVDWQTSQYSVRLRGLSYLYEKNSTIRKKKDITYDNTTLRNIVQSVAQRNKLKLLWFGTDQTIEETYQRKESDWKFLTRLSKEFGAFFKIYNKNLVWSVSTDNYVFTTDGTTVSVSSTGSGQRYLELLPDYFTSLEISLKANKKTKATWESVDIFNKKLNKGLGDKSDDLDLGPVSADAIAIKTKVSNKAKGSVTRDYLEGDLNIRGVLPITDISSIKANELVSGSIIYLVDQGKLTGTYVIESATHSINKHQGWIVGIEASRLTSGELPKPTATQKFNRRVAGKIKVKEIENTIVETSAKDTYEQTPQQKVSSDNRKVIKDTPLRPEASNSTVGYTHPLSR